MWHFGALGALSLPRRPNNPNTGGRTAQRLAGTIPRTGQVPFFEQKNTDLGGDVSEVVADTTLASILFCMGRWCCPRRLSFLFLASLQLLLRLLTSSSWHYDGSVPAHGHSFPWKRPSLGSFSAPHHRGKLRELGSRASQSTTFKCERQSPATRIFIDFILFRHPAAVTDTVLDIPVWREAGTLDSAARLIACFLADNTEFSSLFSSTRLLTATLRPNLNHDVPTVGYGLEICSTVSVFQQGRS